MTRYTCHFAGPVSFDSPKTYKVVDRYISKQEWEKGLIVVDEFQCYQLPLDYPRLAGNYSVSLQRLSGTRFIAVPDMTGIHHGL